MELTHFSISSCREPRAGTVKESPQFLAQWVERTANLLTDKVRAEHTWEKG